MELNISNIQHFSTGDGDGIRTTVFFKGCNLMCPWCHNPEGISFAPCEMNYKTTGKKETVGRKVTVEEILPELLEDKDYFDESGGGVTFSGGEVMLQPLGAASLAKALGENDVSVLIDTAGCVDFSAFEKVDPVVSGYLFDFKTASAEKYHSIGADAALISNNLLRLTENGANVTVRIPLIPDFNTDERSILEICEHLKKIRIKKVDLLPFHRLGSAKYEALGLDYKYKSYKMQERDELERILARYSQYFESKIL